MRQVGVRASQSFDSHGTPIAVYVLLRHVTRMDKANGMVTLAIRQRCRHRQGRICWKGDVGGERCGYDTDTRQIALRMGIFSVRMVGMVPCSKQFALSREPEAGE